LSSHTINVNPPRDAAPPPAPPSAKSLTKEEQEKKKKKEEEDSLNKYKWVGPLITTIAAFASAYTWRGYQRCKATFDYTMQVQTNLRQFLDHRATPIKYTLERIVNLKLKVDAIRYKIIYRYFLACAGILIGGGILTLAAYTHQPRLIPWGQIAIVVAAIWAAASAGFHWHDNQDIRKIYNNIANPPERLGDFVLSQLFHYYQENMTLLQMYYQNPNYFIAFPVGQPGGYQPYFPGHFVLTHPPHVVNGYEKGYSGLYRAHSHQYDYVVAPSAPPEGV
ncbi:MAG TPA: hypothetical protein VFU89_00940, partial [Rhabdochlamydiaceae bacterium]|nr:hypothetical protein [Rhabdochlamydiaceae bacterium]